MIDALSDCMTELYNSLCLAIDAFKDYIDAFDTCIELYFERTENFSRKLVRSLEARYTAPYLSTRYYRRGAV